MADKNSERLMEKFQRKYNLPVTIEEVETMQTKFRYLDNFLFEKQDKNPEGKKYLNGLMYLLNRHIERTIYPTGGKDYFLNKIDFIEFIRDYETVMQARHEEKNPDKPRKANEGIGNTILKEVVARTQKYNKSMVEIYAEGIKSGFIELPDLKHTTDCMYEDVKTTIVPSMTVSGMRTGILAYEAMKKVTSERGFWWKVNPFNWGRARQEKNYMKQLEAEIAEWRERKLPVDSILAEYSKPALEEAYEKVETYRQQRLQAAAEKKAQQVVDNGVERENVQVVEAVAQVQENVVAPVENAPSIDAPAISANK